ncbi:Uncharacterised protein [Klebsiella michiganensis]|nr:Uncharacterised protein [Klebsiella michiganensis]
MKLAPQSRGILRQYKALINARCRDGGQRELTTTQVMDEICEYMICQCAVYIGGHFILQGERHDKSQGRGGTSAASGRAKTRAGCACRRETSPRILLSVVSRCCPGIRVLSGISSCKADR